MAPGDTAAKVAARGAAKAAGDGLTFKDKSKPGDVRQSNMLAAKG